MPAQDLMAGTGRKMPWWYFVAETRMDGCVDFALRSSYTISQSVCSICCLYICLFMIRDKVKAHVFLMMTEKLFRAPPERSSAFLNAAGFSRMSRFRVHR